MSTNFQLKPFRINLADLNFMRDQIAFKPLFDINGNALINWDGTTDAFDRTGMQIAWGTNDAAQNVIDFGTSYFSQTSAQGLRDVTGLHNNLLGVNQAWGAVDQAFLQTVASDFNNYIQPMAVGGLGSFYADKAFAPLSSTLTAIQANQSNAGPDYTKNYAHPGGTNNLGENNGTIVDYTPRMISRTITTGEATPLTNATGQAEHWYQAKYGAGQEDILANISSANATYAGLVNGSGVDIATLIEGAAIITDYGLLEQLGQRDMQDPTNSEFFIGSTNPGVAPGNSWLAYFGQFFDHGLDFVDKGQGLTPSKIYIPLAIDDPLYRAPGTNGSGDQGNTKIVVSRANVSGYDAQGNAEWVNHSSPYIDQSQTYGSSDQMTQLLRKWVTTDGSTFHAGAELLDGETSVAWKNAFDELTNATLPTLNELRAHLLATGRDDLSWDDVSNLRNRDANGDVVVGVDAGFSGQALLLDMNPQFVMGSGHIDLAKLQAIDPSITGITIGGPSLVTVHYGSDPDVTLPQIVNFSNFSIFPVGAITQAQYDVANEILMGAVGDHYIAGDGRVNENIGLTTIHHVFHEEHNFQVRNIENAILAQDARAVILGDTTHSIAHDWQIDTGVTDGNGNFLRQAYSEEGFALEVSPGVPQTETAWDDAKIFDAAKLTVEMEYQHTAVDQYARTITPDLPEFVGYNSGENATVSLEYAQAAFRFGHSTMRETIDIMDPNGSITGQVMSIALEQAFLNPGLYASTGAAAIAMGMTHQQMSEVDEILTPAMNQGLLGQPLDLAAINIARGRDVGLPTLNDFRVAVGLSAYTSWSDYGANMIHPESLVNYIAAYSFDGDVSKARAIVGLESGELSEGDSAAMGFTLNYAIDFLYGADNGYNHIDTWIGGLGEAHVMGGLLGETFNLVFVNQIQRLMDGDRFYYLYRLNNMQLGDEIANAQFKDLIERNTGLEHLNGSAFAYADQYVDLSDAATADFKTEHKYADQLAANPGMGVWSGFGTSTNSNGSIVTVSGQQYIRDIRAEDAYGNPNASADGMALDGTPQTGANSNEVIVATDFKDYIVAMGGDDTVYGEGGDDTILGGAGIDRLYGGDGNDTISGGDSGDLIDGGDGDDILSGDTSGSAAAGLDQIIGGAGNDIIYGGVGIDKLSGGSGDDVIFGGGDTDAFTHGGDGNDYIDGQSDGDLLWGDDGDDLIVGGNNQDIVAGLDGDDILRPGNPSSAMGGGPDEVLGGDGVSDLGNGGQGVGFDLIDFSDYVASSVGVHADFITQRNPLIAIDGNALFPAWTGVEGMIGSRNNDTAIGDSNGNWLIGGSGNDTLTGGAGNDLLIGDGIRLDSLIGTYAGGYGFEFDGATHRTYGGTQINNNGLLDQAAGFDKHFTEILKSEMFKDLELGGNTMHILPNTMGGGTTGDGGTVGAADVAVFSGNLLDYTFTHFTFTDAYGTHINALKVEDSVTNRDGIDLLVGIEKANFADFGNVSLLNGTNNAPIGSASAILASGTEDVAYIVTLEQLLAGFVDVDGNTLSVTNLSAGANGTVTTNLAGDFVITPTPNFNGTVTLTYTVDDGNFGAIAGIQTFNLTAANDATDGAVVMSSTTPYLLQTLTASNTLTDIDGNITLLGYQWQTSANSGATWTTVGSLPSYTTTVADGNKQIRVVESYRVGSSLAIETVASTPSTVQNFITRTGTPDADAVALLRPLAANIAVSHHIYGLGSNDVLRGGTKADILDGGAGDDSMTGLAGNDIYIVDSMTDSVVEAAGGGTDTAVSSAATYTLTTNVENLTLTGTGNINGTGNTLSNSITGNDGNNVLNGGSSIDVMNGGAGNDTYIVDVLGDVIVEAANDGTDTVSTSITYSLDALANVENLTLTGNANRNGTGNMLDNVITGNIGNNTLNAGTAGTDNLIGDTGNDIYVVNHAGVTVIEGVGAGIDTVQASVTTTLSDNVENLTLTGAAAINGTGNAGNNVIVGNGSENTLNAGNAGSDSLRGGLGNDTYIVDHAGVTVVETGVGTDTVESSVSFTLGANVEDLTLTGTDTINGTGNTGANTIIGNDSANTINSGGGAGVDTLIGGGGNDTYIVSNTDTTVVEDVGGGNDTVQSSTSFSLAGTEIENLTLTGTGNNTATGSTGANVIFGNTGANTITGGADADTLTGGAGKDTFVISAPTDSSVEASDVITDFASVSAVTLAASDRISLTAIDASVTAANNNAFTFIGLAAFTGTEGQLRYENIGAYTFVLGDVNGDAVADFSVQLSGLQTLGVTDFLL
jgi:Ca2+-binding RTX toxin-like protein